MKMAIPLFLALMQHHVVGVAHAFQPPTQFGFGGRLRPLMQRHPGASCRRTFDVSLAAAGGDAALDDVLEKFALPLEFKKGGDAPSKGNGGDNAGVIIAESDTKSSSPTPKTESSTDSKAIDMSTFTPSADTPLANKYYMKKMQMAEEAKKADSSAEQSTMVSTESPSPAPPVPVAPPRRRFTDFGIASEQAEPTSGETIVQDSGASTSEDSTTATKLRGFTDLSMTRQSRPIKVTMEGNESSPKKAPETKPDTSSPPRATANEAGNAPDATVGDTAKPTVTQSAKEEQVPSAAATVKEEKAAPSATPAMKEEKAVTAPVTAPKETVSAPPNPKVTISQPSTELIQSEPASPTGQLTMPSMNLDVEDYGIVPLVIIGVSVISALGVFLKPVNESKDDNEPGMVGKITEESKNLLQKVKDAGTAGAISYAAWELAFWGISIPVCVVSYQKVTGHWPDLTDRDDLREIGLEAFAFVNFARLAVPLRIGLALSTVPWVEENIISRMKGSDSSDSEEEEEVADGSSEQIMLSSTTVDSAQYPGDAGSESARMEDLDVQPPSAAEQMQDESTTDILAVEERLNRMEDEASRISSKALETINVGIDPTLLEYCEPGQVTEDCSESIQGYLDSLASTGAVATDGEVKAIIGYLDSLSSNVAPNGKTGAAFTSYLDALSTGFVAAPSSAKAVASYLDVLSNGDGTVPPSDERSPPEEKIGSRINEVEERLSRLESSVSSLPDDIASRLTDWQISQDKKMSDEMKKIATLLVGEKSLENLAYQEFLDEN